MMRILLTEMAPGAAEGVRAVLAAQEEVEVVGYPRDGLEAAQMAVHLEPDILLLHDQLPGMTGALACELASLAAPEVACCLLCENDSPETLKRAMRAGARAVVTPLTNGEELAKTLRDIASVRARLDEPEYKLITDRSAMPLTIALVSARDGVGKSTMATNLGATLAERFPEEAVLVDLYGQFGSIALLLNMNPTYTITDLAGLAADMDLDLLETFLATHESGLKVLAGGVKPDPAWTDALSVGFIANLMGLLRRRYRFLICDVPSMMWPGSLYVMSRAQHCLAITSLWDVTAMREMAALSDALVPAHVTPERYKMIVNRNSNQNDHFSESDLAAATGREVWHKLPNDPTNVYAAANEGAPVIAAKPAAPFSKSVAALADKLIEEAELES